MVRRRQRVLVGFDFAFGLPSGFASALGLNDEPAWLAVWREITKRIVDRGDNTNNRFEVAADFNRRISGGGYPFWGCPVNTACSTLFSTKQAGGLAEKRHTDVGNMQPVWKLYGNGSVGSQGLLGIPHVFALRHDPELAPVSVVWPFETGLRPLSPHSTPNWLILHAEIYPSLLPVKPLPSEVKDAVQVRELAAHFAALDSANKFADLFAGSGALTAGEREIVEREEGWALGVGNNRRLQVRSLEVEPLVVRVPEEKRLPSGHPRAGGTGRTTVPGYENRNWQVVVRDTGLTGTDHGQYVYVLRCGDCTYEYGANGSDVFQRRCPRCQGGRPGLQY